MQRQTWSLSGLSVELGLDRRTLAKYLADIQPAETRDTGRGLERRWFLADIFGVAVKASAAGSPSSSSFDRLNEVRAKREEINLRRDLGQVVFIPDIRPALARYVDDILSVLLGIPEKYAQQLEQTAGVEGKHQVLADMVVEIRETMGNYEFVDRAPASSLVETSARRAGEGAGEASDGTAG